jgi:2-phosphoglycerate kinase
VKIKNLFREGIMLPIEPIIHVDVLDEQIVAREIDEYVVTDNIRDNLEDLSELYADTVRNPSESTNVWVSGFFGSGKSSFAKMVGYSLTNPQVQGRSATERLLATYELDQTRSTSQYGAHPRTGDHCLP